MATEVLCVPEERLEEVIRVIRIGLLHTVVSEVTQSMLRRWCESEESYLRRLKGEEDK